MKTYNNLYPQITAFENLYHAYRLARRGKRERVAVANFEFNLESDLLQLQEELQSQTYQPGMYHNFFIFEPKRRLVSAALSLLSYPCNYLFAAYHISDRSATKHLDKQESELKNNT
jgi:hypothetical protein